MELVLIRGLPGSGKSTMAKVIALLGYRHFEADQYFTGSDGQYMYNPAKISEAHEWCLAQTEYAMARGHRCVVANTFTRQWEMKRYIDAALRYRYRYHVLVATGNYQNVHGVSEEVIQKMRNRREP